MSVRHIALVLAIAALGVPAAYAQTTPETASAPAAATAAAPAPMDCKGMAKHDHGAEKGTPMAMPAACAASASKVKAAKAKAGHDHAKVHKLM
jgi:hypothetical protein